MRAVFARDIAKIALDAFRFIDFRDRLVQQVEAAEIGDALKRAAAEVGDRPKPLLLHPVREPLDEVVDQSKAVVHDRGADLDARRAEQDKLCRVPPVANPPDAGYRQVHLRVARDLGDHVQRDRLDRRAGISAVGPFSVDGGHRRV